MEYFKNGRVFPRIKSTKPCIIYEPSSIGEDISSTPVDTMAKKFNTALFVDLILLNSLSIE